MDAYCQAATDVGARVSSEFYNGLRQMVLGKDTTLSLQSGRSPEATKQYQERMKDPDFADRMRAAAHTAKDMQLSKKNGDKLSTLRSNSIIRIGDIRSSNIIRRNKQFGHKATTHRKDWIARIGALIRNPKNGRREAEGHHRYDN